MIDILKTMSSDGFIIVALCDGVPCTITGKWMSELLIDWCIHPEDYPSKDSKVLLFAYDRMRAGTPKTYYKVVNGTEYTDFESVMNWITRHIANR